MNIFDTLMTNVSHSSAQGVIGVAVIAAYFILIVGVALYRVKQGSHMDH